MRIAIAEDSGFLRAALAESLSSTGHDVMVAVDNADDLLQMIETDLPDVALLDICLPPTRTDEGLVAAEKIKSTYPNVGVLVLSAYLATPHVSRLLRGSADCF